MRWLGARMVTDNEAYWGNRMASLALRQWIKVLFARETLERIGLTTWSGNPRMMALAAKLGFKLEGQLRKVRYHNGQYYDAIRYGVLRSEWAAQNQPIDPAADNQ
ncbi:MAG: GNAT family N-acetyltransferase [Gammaproteobacteria bacterium]|nr:GNAT family N-acetyltransferase [Gammaproteobacteria bacterium]